MFVSPKVASRAARVKVTQPPWGSKPSAVTTLSPFGLAAGDAWLSSHQEARLRLRVEANLPALAIDQTAASDRFVSRLRPVARPSPSPDQRGQPKR